MAPALSTSVDTTVTTSHPWRCGPELVEDKPFVAKSREFNPKLSLDDYSDLSDDEDIHVPDRDQRLVSTDEGSESTNECSLPVAAHPKAKRPPLQRTPSTRGGSPTPDLCSDDTSSTASVSGTSRSHSAELSTPDVPSESVAAPLDLCSRGPFTVQALLQWRHAAPSECPACRVEIAATLAELRVSTNVADAIARIVDIGVPIASQPLELCAMLAQIAKEESQEVRKRGFALAAGLFLGDHWKSESAAKGIRRFVEDTCADLKYDVPALSRILRDELHPALAPLPGRILHWLPIMQANLLDAENRNSLTCAC